MAFRIGVDIGGTFTDCIVVDEDGGRTVSKSLTTHDALADGVLSALEVNAGERGIDSAALLSGCDLFVHGTTVATNALLTRNGSRTGLITTAGHEDALIIGKVFSKRAGLGEREIVHSTRLRKPDPIVPPELIVGVRERVDRDGDVVVELREEEATAAIDAMLEAGVEAVAVSLLWAHVNDDHEQMIKRLIAERAPQLFSCFSAEMAPVTGEYERTATTALNAYIGPKVKGYLSELERRLLAEGLGRPLMIMQANGGLTSVDDASARPILTLDSGPTGGVLGCRYIATLHDAPNVVCTDVGGTSFDVAVIAGDEVPLESEPVVSQYTISMPKVAVASIGAGGGSIAWIDTGGVLRVGPQSAGSRPGPACYGRGGDQPTVTDADLVLGYLDPKAFLGGRMELDVEAARRALGRVGAPLGLEPEEAAAGVFRIINAHMGDLIRKSTVERGHDPRNCVVLAYGGAGPTHAVFYGADIGSRAILIPPESTVFSAFGMLTCDVTHIAEASELRGSPFDAEDVAALDRQFARVEEGVLERFRAEGQKPEDVTLVRHVGMHYRQQVHMVDVPVAAGPVDGGTLAEVQAEFERLYARIYGEGSVLRGGGVELARLRVTGTVAVDAVPLLSERVGSSDPAAALKGQRQAYFEPVGFSDTPVYSGDRLAAGNLVEGPAIIERMGDSVVIPPGFEALVDASLTLKITNINAAQSGPGLSAQQEVVA
jgi:N-methylhydantoinase A/oxoprolinase/acetone carboxylase beta subunit